MSDAKPSLSKVLAEVYHDLVREGEGKKANAVQAAFFLLSGQADERIVSLFDLSPLVPPATLVDGQTLWLWQNGDHFLAFEHLYPCVSPGGDPMTLGEPFGRAVFRRSSDRSRAPLSPSAAVMKVMAESVPPLELSDAAKRGISPASAWPFQAGQAPDLTTLGECGGALCKGSEHHPTCQHHASAGFQVPDPLVDKARIVVQVSRRASISAVQRYLRIGYNRAARLLEALEADGVVSTIDATGNRRVLR